MYLAKQIHFDHIDSTNTWAKLHSDQWDPCGLTLITASTQSGGRGRFNRVWVSPPNLNIYATFCFWIPVSREDIGHIPQVLAIAAAQTVESLGFFSKIKWPNDLLIQGKKMAGILCETILEGDRRGVICGIGLNVNMPPEILQQIDRPATSLFVEGDRVLEVEAVLNILKERFLDLINIFLENGFSPLFSLFEEKSALRPGDRLCFHDNQTLIEVQFVRLHSNGSVELCLADGTHKIFHAGEFISNRPLT